MAKAVGIQIGTGLTGCRHKRWVDGYANNIVAGRNWCLAVSSVKHKILTAELPNISIRPADTDTLIASDGRLGRSCGRTARYIVTVVASRARIRLIFLDVYHAKSALGSTPNVTSCRID